MRSVQIDAPRRLAPQPQTGLSHGASEDEESLDDLRLLAVKRRPLEASAWIRLAPTTVNNVLNVASDRMRVVVLPRYDEQPSRLPQ